MYILQVESEMFTHSEKVIINNKIMLCQEYRENSIKRTQKVFLTKAKLKPGLYIRNSVASF